MKNVFFFLLLGFTPLLSIAQGDEQPCAPVKDGMVCYEDIATVRNTTQTQLYSAICQWAKEEYGLDLFYSNVLCNKDKGTVFVSSKVELLLNETDRTEVKYKLYISCQDNRYHVELKEIRYQYNPEKQQRVRSYPAESIILNNGKENKISSIKNPELFCQATRFFADELFNEIAEAAGRR